MFRKTCFTAATVCLIVFLISCGQAVGPVIKDARYYEDGPWWNAEICEPDLSDIDNVQTTDIIAANGEYCVMNIYMDSYSTPTLLRRYNYAGELCGEIKPADYTDLSVEMCSDNGKFYAVSDRIYEADFDNGSFIDPKSVRLPSSAKMITGINRIVRKGDTCIYLCSSSDRNGTEQFFVHDDGSKQRIFEPDFGNDADECYVINMMMYGDRLVFEANVVRGNDYCEYICVLDPETSEMQSRPVLNGYHNGAFITDDGVYYTVDDRDAHSTKIIKYDPGTNAFVEILDLADTYVNNLFCLNANYHVIYAEDTRVVVKADKEGVSWSCGDPVIITLTRSDSNPNAGKQVLELGYITEEPQRLLQIVSEFNNNNDKYYIEPAGKYCDHEKTLQQRADDLMNDIRSGTGPDVVILNSEFASMNDDRYLRRADDGTYRYCYCQSYKGLIVKTSLLSNPASPGITYEEYDELVRRSANGNNVLGTRIDTFNTLFKFSADKFFDEKGCVDLQNEDFRALAEFAGSLCDPGPAPEYSAISAIDNASYNGFTGFLKRYGRYCSDYSIIGYPSRDGLQPEKIDRSGIGITSCCSSEEGCMEFINMLASPENQCRAGYEKDPVSEQGLRMKSDIIVAESNRHDRNNAVAGPDGWPSDAVDHYISQVADAASVPDVDSSVLIILDEEIQPYLDGQKSLDDVILIAENRINLMLDERK